MPWVEQLRSPPWGPAGWSFIAVRVQDKNLPQALGGVFSGFLLSLPHPLPPLPLPSWETPLESPQPEKES